MPQTCQIGKHPSLFQRLYSVWHRHVRVYNKDFVSNAFPPFIEPIIFLLGIGLGLGQYIEGIGDTPFLPFLATGLLVTSSMFTAAYECTYGTFIRLEFDKAYDGILSAPINVYNLIIGEILWAGTKGLFFSFAVLVILSLFGVISFSSGILAPLVGMLTGLMFGTLSLLVTSYVKNINYFNFYFTGLISPMFFFSGVMFPINSLPTYLRPLAELLPLTHSVRLVRSICSWDFNTMQLGWDLTYVTLFIIIIGYLGIKKLQTRLID